MLLFYFFLFNFAKNQNMKVVKVSYIIAMLEADGWSIKACRGSHRQFTHPTKQGKVTVNGKPSDDVYGSLLKSIESQSGLKF